MKATLGKWLRPLTLYGSSQLDWFLNIWTREAVDLADKQHIETSALLYTAVITILTSLIAHQYFVDRSNYHMPRTRFLLVLLHLGFLLSLRTRFRKYHAAVYVAFLHLAFFVLSIQFSGSDGMVHRSLVTAFVAMMLIGSHASFLVICAHFVFQYYFELRESQGVRYRPDDMSDNEYMQTLKNLFYSTTAFLFALMWIVRFMMRRNDAATRRIADGKSNLINKLAHDVRTPLTAIVSAVELIKDAPLTTEQLHMISVMETSSANLHGLMDDLLESSKIESGRSLVRLDYVSLNDIVNQTVQMFNAIARSKANSIEVKLSDDVPDIIYTDRVKYSQILTNLVSNALKFTKNGKIVIQYIMVEQKLVTIVSDTGEGMDEATQNTIWEPFFSSPYEVDTSGKRYPGVGLGLSIVKKLVHLLKGHIELTSKSGVGSEFTVTLPLLSPNKT